MTKRAPTDSHWQRESGSDQKNRTAHSQSAEQARMLVIRALLTATALFASASALRAESAPSFVNDIVPIFTRFGCSQGSCHGKGAGQNGFRLSLRGYAPEQDHEWLTREFFSRRISRTSPESSTVLRKAAGLATHEGGKLFN